MKTRWNRASLVPALGVALSLYAAGEVVAATAREMLDETKRLNDTSRSWADRSQHLAILVVDPGGKERHRDILVKTQRGIGGEDKSLALVLGPADVRGTAFLQFAHRDRDAEQWLYLPEFQRVRQITPRAKDESFMGTDFSYRDLELITDAVEWTEDEAKSTLLKTESSSDGQINAIELLPQKKEIGYRRLVVLLSTPDHVVRGIEFYAEAEQPKKVLHMDGIGPIDGVPTPSHLEMSCASGGRTSVDVSDVRYNQKFSDDVFTKHTLEQGVDANLQ
jgi:Outer membrane lipoprotein-sorting protein